MAARQFLPHLPLVRRRARKFLKLPHARRQDAERRQHHRRKRSVMDRHHDRPRNPARHEIAEPEHGKQDINQTARHRTVAVFQLLFAFRRPELRIDPLRQQPVRVGEALQNPIRATQRDPAEQRLLEAEIARPGESGRQPEGDQSEIERSRTIQPHRRRELRDRTPERLAGQGLRHPVERLEQRLVPAVPLLRPEGVKRPAAVPAADRQPFRRQLGDRLHPAVDFEADAPAVRGPDETERMKTAAAVPGGKEPDPVQRPPIEFEVTCLEPAPLTVHPEPHQRRSLKPVTRIGRVAVTGDRLQRCPVKRLLAFDDEGHLPLRPPPRREIQQHTAKTVHPSPLLFNMGRPGGCILSGRTVISARRPPVRPAAGRRFRQ